MDPNFHASAVVLEGRGVLVAGPSGSGKTRLALALVREARRDGRAAAFVSDDQVLLAPDEEGRLIARAPPTISGRVEIRGLGVVPIEAAPLCAIDLLIRLVPLRSAPRMREGGSERLCGVALPRLDLPRRDCDGAVLAVNAFLFGTVI